MRMDRYSSQQRGISLLISMLILCVSFSFAQERKETNSRVMSNLYWQKMAEQGLAELNPEIEMPPAVQRAQDGKSQFVTDVTDVAPTSASNVTQSEVSIFVSPTNNQEVLNSNNSTDWNGSSVSSLFGTSGFFSTNGGASYGGSANGTGGSNSGDPAACVDLNGNYYVNFIDLGLGQGVAVSTNGGASWTPYTIRSLGGGFFDVLDKNHMWVDNSPSSPHEGNLYAAWTAIVAGDPNENEIELSRSTNSGVTWSSTVGISQAVNAGSHNQGVNIQTGPNGEVYAVWAIYDSWPSDETALGFASSSDGGVTWSPATRIISNIKGIRTTENGKNQRVNSFPVMAVDISGGSNDGRIYVVWTNQGVPGINSGSADDIYMIFSDNGGSSWSTPAKVNQDTGNESYFPWITCDPVTGDLAVVFFNDRNVSSTQTETFLATSSDGGATWTDGVISDVAHTPAAIPGLASGYAGDYNGVSMRDGCIYAVWADNRSGAYLAYTNSYCEDGGGNQSPVAEANGPYAADLGNSISFSSAGSFDPDGTITSYFWDFGDGNSSTSANPTHTYGGVGSYNVVLTVTDDMGATDNDAATATVTDPGGSGIPCEDMTVFQARCNNAGSVQMRVFFTDNSHDGEQVTFTIDGTDVQVVTINNNRAQLSLPNYGAGPHTVELTDPAGCFAAFNVNCSVLQADGWQSFDLVPATMELAQNYPNPFNPTTSIRYGLSEDVSVTLKVFNMLGQEVVTLVNDYQNAGYHTIEWDGRNAAGQKAASGIYIYNLRAGDTVISKTMQLTQ